MAYCPLVRGSRLRVFASPLFAMAGLLLDVLVVLACAADAARASKGMDVSFDLLNYHYYYAWLFFHGGVGKADPEPFANRYVNPLAEFPWYLLNQTLSPRASSAAIGAVAGLNLPLIRRITLLLVSYKTSSLGGFALSLAAVTLAGVGAVFRMELGMSVADVVVSLPMLVALLLVLRAARSEGGHAWECLSAGVLAGVAVGAKLTMAPYVLALALGVLLLAIARRRASAVPGYALGGVVGVAVSAGWWFYSVWRATGSPLFPYYNAYFHSPYWPYTNLRDTRFGPHGLLDATGYPLYMLRGTRRLLDVPLQDPRWVVLGALLTMTVLYVVAQWFRGGRRVPARLLSGTDLACTVFLLFFVVSGLAWLFQFGIARYAVTTELLVGPAIVVSLLALLHRALLVSFVGIALAMGMTPFSNGHFYHVPFQRDRFMVKAAPLTAVPGASVVLSDAGSAPSSFLLTYLPNGVKRHVVHPWFYGSPLLEKLKKTQLASAPHIFVIEGRSGRTSPRTRASLLKQLNLVLEPKTCVPIHSSVQLRYLCSARWNGPPAKSTST